jgi:GT2 family glycosyltransferase
VTVDLAVVVVTWNSADHLSACVGAVRDELPFGSEIIVVDNASSDDTPGVARELGVRLVETGANIGFGAACNRGAGETLAHVVLFLNPDCVVRPGAVKAARRALVAAPRIGAVGAALVAPDGTAQPSADEFITPGRFAVRAARTAIGRGGPIRRPPAGPVDWVFGAFLLVRRDAFDEIGGFDPAFHMYYEDMDLCWRLWRAGWEVRFASDAEAVHLGGASASLRWEGFPGREKARSLLRFERKHAPERAGLFRLAAAAAYAGFAALKAVSGIVRRAGTHDARPYWEMAGVFARGED